MKLSRTLTLGLCLLTQMESLAAAETGASKPTANPLAGFNTAVSPAPILYQVPLL